MAFPAVAYPTEHDGLMRKELDQFAATLLGHLSKEHKSDGTHKNITADSLTVTGGVRERGRPGAMGEWIPAPFSAANFVAQGGGVWTVGPAAVLRNRYTLIGSTCVWGVYLSWFSGANQLTGSATSVQIALPVPGLTFDPYQYQTGIYAQANGQRADFDAQPAGGPWIQLSQPSGPLTTGPVGFIMTLVMELLP